MSVAAIANGIYLLDTGGLGIENSIAVYVVKGEKYAAIVDVGYGRAFKRIVNGLKKLGIGPGELHYIIPTHAHLDHCGATGLLASAYPNALVYTHEKAARHIIDPSKLIESVKSIYGELFELFGEVRPVSEERVRVLHNDEEIDLGGIRLRAIYAPGHAPHHMAVLVEGRGHLISADSFAVRYPFADMVIPNTPPPRFDLDDAIKSMEKLYSFSPKLLLMAHFGPVFPSEALLREDVELYKAWTEKIGELMKKYKSPEEIVAKVFEELERPRDRPLHPAVKNLVRVAVLGLYTYISSKS